MTASPRALSTLVAAGRVGVGAGLLVAPGTFGRPWLGAAADGGGTAVAIRAFGARDLVLGAVTTAALLGRLGDGTTAAVLVGASACCDVADGAALHLARRDVPPLGRAVSAFALAAAAGGFALAHRLRTTS